ncbi:insulinase family protein [Halioxenophilus sp. WMMB6]|uniref:insulinase family protein n=1 Tax=Halioxenophilus sp. WMMB6 TaxID=3073815 RepID=UPI00295E5F8E|nr:insulinase family protein [Halioxenophilus sp. WMMB6]
MQSTIHPAFERLRSHTIESLNIQVEEFRHKTTGAQHIHLTADSDENVFLVALRTVPMDSSGVAHILEHTALCGSEKYPVRDPFFMMIRRSLNTFMNAFTSSDWTAYPFASQNRKDFNNLLDVYLDAVFFSRLDPLDFAQEGHRIEFEEPTNPNSPLVYKGVVYNEMKGAMSSVPSQLWQAICKYLFPTTTYHFNSGGDPDVIPNLSYEQLQRFYRTHYHPSNAIFMTFGNIPVIEHQEKFQQQALARFERLDYHVSVANEQRYYAPLRVQESYPLDDSETLEHKTHLVMGWLLGKSTDLDAVLQAQLLNNLLLDNSASPLQKLLETTDLGSAPSPLCGLDDSQKELSFLCGIEGSDAELADQFEQQVLAVIEEIANNGVSEAQLQASLHQLELAQREIGGDSYPYGLQLILSALTSATHRGDPIALLDVEPALQKLREAASAPNFVQNLARKLLLDNPHRVRLCMVPDADISARKVAAEKARLVELKSTLSAEQSQAVVEQAAKLVERQQRVDDESLLPKVTVADVPAAMHYVQGNHQKLGGADLSVYHAGTNGLVYQQIIMELPELPAELLAILPFYSLCLTELGLADKDYLQVQQWQSQVTGGLNAFSSLRGKIDNAQDLIGFITLSGKALVRNQAALSELMLTTLEQVRFDELSRIHELISQTRARREMSVTGSGHSLAMTAAASGLSPGAKLSHELSGLAGIKALKALDKQLDDPEHLAAFGQKLNDIHSRVVKANRRFFLATDAEHSDTCIHQLESSWAASLPDGAEAGFKAEPVSTQVKQAWVTNTQVNFCAKAYPTVPMSHPDAAVLTVLSGFLRNGFLHRAIREQGGAYGGGASHDANSASFRFYSYRDPRLQETLQDFDAALEWLQATEHSPQAVEEAILGVVASLDKPSSPAGEAKQTYHAELAGRDRATRENFRKQVLAVTAESLKRVANTYLQPEKASIAVISHSGNQAAFDQLELATINL